MKLCHSGSKAYKQCKGHREVYLRARKVSHIAVGQMSDPELRPPLTFFVHLFDAR